MNEEQEERLVAAFESIAQSLKRWIENTYPEKKTPRDAKLTYIKTEDEKLREEISGEDAHAPIEEWIGFREKREVTGTGAPEEESANSESEPDQNP